MTVAKREALPVIAVATQTPLREKKNSQRQQMSNSYIPIVTSTKYPLFVIISKFYFPFQPLRCTISVHGTDDGRYSLVSICSTNHLLEQEFL